MKLSTTILLALLLSACGSDETSTETVVSESDSQFSVANGVEIIEAETARLYVWFDEQFEEQLQFNPQLRTRLGDKTDYDRLNDASEAGQLEQIEWLRDSVSHMGNEFDYNNLNADAQLSWDLWSYNLEIAERGLPYRRHSYIFGRGGPHASLPNFLINFHRVDNIDDAQAYISRLGEIPRVFNQLLNRSRLAATDGIRQPRFAYQFAIDEIGRVTSGAPFTEGDPSPLWHDIQGKIDNLLAADLLDQSQADELLNEASQLLSGPVKDAYDEVLTWLEADIQLSGEEALGVWNLPDGEEFYNYRLFLMTALDLSANEIHEIGLAEVDRLKLEMETIRRQVNFAGSLEEFFVFMRESDQFYFPNTDEGRQAYLDTASDFLSAMNDKLPEYFGRLPQASLEVRRVEAFREQDGAAQHYAAGAPDGSRPGVFYSHLSDMTAMPIYQLEDVAYHEGSPGHHMQISIQQELTDIPRFRTQSRNTAYTEGWGLYAEALAKEMGFFTDPYSDFGRLTGEIWRAIRLVVDTGIHAKQWSQEQAVEYMLTNAPLAEGAVRSEIQRYITGPGQATAYKIGMLKFQEFRDKASTALGDDFDIREFHDVVLGSGALPMPILEARIDRWIQEQ